MLEVKYECDRGMHKMILHPFSVKTDWKYSRSDKAKFDLKNNLVQD